MVRGRTGGQLNRRNSETPDVCLKVITCHLIWKEKNQIKNSINPVSCDFPRHQFSWILQNLDFFG